jgi:hypothetical protein
MTGGYVTPGRFLEKNFAPGSLAGLRLKKRQCFGETGVFQKMPQPGIQVAVVLILPCQNRHRDFLQPFQMPRWITVPPRMIGDDGFTATEQINEVLVHGHGNQARDPRFRQHSSSANPLLRDRVPLLETPRGAVERCPGNPPIHSPVPGEGLSGFDRGRAVAGTRRRRNTSRPRGA